MDRILSHILVKFMNFWVAKMYGNNGTFYGGPKYRNSSHTLTVNYYCKCSITNAGPISDNEVNLLPLPYKCTIVLHYCYPEYHCLKANDVSHSYSIQHVMCCM